MNLSIGQLLQLVRGALEAEPANIARNQSLRNLAQLERNASQYLSRGIHLPEEKSDPFGKESQSLKEPEVVSPAETVEEEPRRSYRRYTKKDEDTEV
jgi:hypothetical protein